MSLGIAVDYGIVSPSHMSTFSSAAALMDMPFLFRDTQHWTSVMASDAFAPLADEIARRADVQLIGYAGGGVRNVIAKKPVATTDQLNGLTIRVMGAPIQTGRMLEFTEDAKILNSLIDAGKITVHPFPERQELLERATRVKQECAAQIGAETVLARINEIQ